MATGRPRQFDYETALDAAVETFWLKGYDGCSLADLELAMGISRPSLYAAFGSKEELFLAAIDRYLQQKSERALLVWKLGGEFQTCLLALLNEAIAGLFVEGKAKGCLIASVLVEESCDSAKARAKLIQCLEGMDKAIEDRLAACQDTCLSDGIDLASAARIITIFLNGLAGRARAGEGELDLRKVAKYFHAALSNHLCNQECLRNHRKD